MVARIATVAFQGIDVLEVDVQVQIAAGLPDRAVGESRERVRAALLAEGSARLQLPARGYLGSCGSSASWPISRLPPALSPRRSRTGASAFANEAPGAVMPGDGVAIGGASELLAAPSAAGLGEHSDARTHAWAGGDH